MGVLICGVSDPMTEAFADQLRGYAASHPNAIVEVNRKSPVTIYVRILNPEFSGQNRVERHKEIWPLLRGLPDETLSELGMLILLTPEEKLTSQSSRNFETEDLFSDLEKLIGLT